MRGRRTSPHHRQGVCDEIESRYPDWSVSFDGGRYVASSDKWSAEVRSPSVNALMRLIEGTMKP